MEDSDKKKPSAPIRKGLGKGLGTILGEQYLDVKEVIAEKNEKSFVAEIPITQIETNPFQPRIQFEANALEELADSIKVQGIIQPITVRKLHDKAYQLISGERRLQASKLIGLETIPAYIRTANDEQMLEMALIENVQRVDLNPIEVALAYKRLMDECNLIIEQVGEKVGKKRPTINNYLRLLKLPPEVQIALKETKISMGHARALLGIDDPIKLLDFYKQIIEQDLSVREVELAVQNIGLLKKGKEPKQKPHSPYHIQLQQVERNLTNRFNAKIKITGKDDGKGEIKIQFLSNDDFNRLLELLS